MYTLSDDASGAIHTANYSLIASHVKRSQGGFPPAPPNLLAGWGP